MVAAGRSRRAGLAGLGAALVLASVPARAGDEGDLFDRAGWSRLVAGRQPAWDTGAAPPLLLEVDARPPVAKTVPAVPKSEPSTPRSARPEDSRPRSGPAEPTREPAKRPAPSQPTAAVPPRPAAAPIGSVPAPSAPRAAEDLFDRAGWAAPPAVRPAWVDGARPTE